MMTTILGI